MNEIENLYFEISKRDKVIRNKNEENISMKRYNESLKNEYQRVRDQQSKKDDIIADLKEKIGQLENDKIVYSLILKLLSILVRRRSMMRI